MIKRPVTHGNKQVGHLLLILNPGLAVLGSAPLDVTQGAVADHTGKEERVEPGEWAFKPGDQAPVEGKVEIARVVDLASLAICAVY